MTKPGTFPTHSLIVTECKAIEFAGKDIITVKNWDDFVALIQPTDKFVYKLGNKYYLISIEVAWVYDNG